MKKEIYLPISNRLLALILFIGILGGWFYWFQYRPTQIIENCHSFTKDQIVGSVKVEGVEVLDETFNLYINHDKVGSFIDGIFEDCLREHGVKE